MCQMLELGLELTRFATHPTPDTNHHRLT